MRRSRKLGCRYARKIVSSFPQTTSELYHANFRGVSKIRLVDFDYVTLSSLNRHATAALSDVGTPKVRCVEKALREFSKWVEIDARIDVWKKEGGGALLEGADWVFGEFHETFTNKTFDFRTRCH